MKSFTGIVKSNCECNSLSCGTELISGNSGSVGRKNGAFTIDYLNNVAVHKLVHL